MAEEGDKQRLAKVTGELADPRGPDVRSKVTVPAEWLLHGGQLRVSRPRLASCNECRGGGCATCRYQGAFSLSRVDAPELSLPAQPDPGVLTVRLPHLGFKRDTDEVAGHWLLEVHPGAECSRDVTLSERVSPGGSWLWKIGVMGVLLLLFWLWLSLV